MGIWNNFNFPIATRTHLQTDITDTQTHVIIDTEGERERESGGLERTERESFEEMFTIFPPFYIFIDSSISNTIFKTLDLN